MWGSKPFSSVKTFCCRGRAVEISFFKWPTSLKGSDIKFSLTQKYRRNPALCRSWRNSKSLATVTVMSPCWRLSVQSPPEPQSSSCCPKSHLNTTHILKLNTKQTWSSSLLRIWLWLKCNKQEVRILVAKNSCWKQKLSYSFLIHLWLEQCLVGWLVSELMRGLKREKEILQDCSSWRTTLKKLRKQIQ